MAIELLSTSYDYSGLRFDVFLFFIFIGGSV